MKKILALLLALAMLVTVTPVFAEETDAAAGSDGTTEEVTYDSLADQYDAEVGNFTRIQTSWKVIGGAVSPMSGNSSKSYTSGSGMFAILKVDLPTIGNGQKYGKMIVRFAHSAGTDNNIAFKVEGIDVPNVSSIADTDFYKTIIKNRTASQYIAYDASNPIVTESMSGTNFHYVDITNWAQQSYYEGKDYVYLAVGSWNSTVDLYATTLTDGDYTRAKYYPSYWYSIEDVEELAPIEQTLEAYKAMPNLTNVTMSYYGGSGIINDASGHFGSSYFTQGQFVVYKIPMPVVPIGKTLGNFVLRTGTDKEAIRLLKMAGEDWTVPGDLSAWYTANKTQAKFEALYAYDGDIIFETPTHNINAYFDVSKYVRDCYAAGQDYIYLAAAPYNNRTKIALHTLSDGDYVASGNKPQYYYTFSDIPALSYISANVDNGEIISETQVEFTFSNVLKSATAKINGNDLVCEVKGNKAIVQLTPYVTSNIVVTATDNARNVVASDPITVKAGYGNKTIVDDYNTKLVSNSGASDSKYSPRVNNSESTVMRIKLPSIEEGKTIKEFGIKFLSGERRYPTSFRLFKIPFDGAVCANLIQTSGETPDGKINIQVYKTGAYNEYKANLGEFEYGGITAKNDHVHYADITKYVKECYERGQTTMLIGFTANDSQSMVGIGDGDLDTAKRYHYIYWTVEDTDFSAKAPKFVASDDANTFANATGLASLAKAAEYKFITSLANFGAEDASVTLYIAQYADGELIGITPKTVTVTANGTAADFTSANFTVDALAENVKAFIWNDAEQKPMLIGDVVVDAK